MAALDPLSGSSAEGIEVFFSGRTRTVLLVPMIWVKGVFCGADHAVHEGKSRADRVLPRTSAEAPIPFVSQFSTRRQSSLARQRKALQ